ncbi:hypothetical protein AcW1_008293 [Taiwanofungus camphoratus]|nr:hypothetical protein AcW1_008293 [Antrodia cinnamomea]KAI0956069.1 hypothetical protein AcV7_006576 [Antrodia cinnamomea]
MSRADDSEIIQDSEDEDSLLLDSPNNAAETSITSISSDNFRSEKDARSGSSIQTANFTNQSQVSGDTKEISSFTNIASTIPSIIAGASSSSKPACKPRPRPRPAYKGAAARNGAPNDSSSNKAPSSIEVSTISADVVSLSNIRTTGSSKPGPPLRSASKGLPITEGQTSTYSAPDDLGITVSSVSSGSKGKTKSAVDGDAFESYSQDIAERAKLRARTLSAKSKEKQQFLAGNDDVIDISSGDDELALLPPVKLTMRMPPRPPQSKKCAKTAHTLTDGSASGKESVPVATSDLTLDLSSQLPPSDPPSTMAPSSPKPADIVPVSNTDLSPLSSPLPAAPRKRKRNAPVLELGEWDKGIGAEFEMPNAQENGQLMLPPPPVFAASSSSAVASPSKAGLVEQPGEEKARGKKGRSNVDEKDDDDEWAGEPPSKSKARPRKKARVDDDEAEWEGDVPVKATRKPRRKGRGEREDDEDWTGDAPSKAKPKAPPRKRGKKNKVEQKQVEVVIDAPKAGKGPKDQAKTKAPTSRESAADFDGEDYSMLMPPPQVLPSDVPHGPELADIEVPSAEPDSEHTGNTRAVGAKKGGGSPASFVGPEPQLLKKVSPSNGTRDATDGNSAVAATKNKGKKRTVILSDDEDEGEGASSHGSPPKRRKGRKSAPAVLSRDDRQSNEEDGPSDAIKENVEPKFANSSATSAAFRPPVPSSSASTTSKFSTSSRSYSAKSGKGTPMSELLRKVNSLPGSPFASPRPTYSPYTKSSKSMLRRIAPLHPNRRTPPPPLPRPPPPKKSKKQLELEERWEMELEESVEGWYCLPEEERAALRRAKRDMEMGFED